MVKSRGEEESSKALLLPPSIGEGAFCFVPPCSSSASLTNTPPEAIDDEVIYSDLIKEYQNIFIKVNEWGKFEESDIRRNDISEVQDQGLIPVPNFVASFEQKLEKMPDVRYFLDLSICCSILTGQCRCVLNSNFLSSISQNILSFVGTNLMRKGAMPSHAKWCISHRLRLANGKTIGKWVPNVS